MATGQGFGELESNAAWEAIVDVAEGYIYAARRLVAVAGFGAGITLGRLTCALRRAHKAVDGDRVVPVGAYQGVLVAFLVVVAGQAAAWSVCFWFVRAEAIVAEVFCTEVVVGAFLVVLAGNAGT